MAAEGFPVGHQESRAFLAQYRHGFVYFVYFVVALSSVSAALRQATKVVCRTNTSPKLRNAALSNAGVPATGQDQQRSPKTMLFQCFPPHFQFR
jgi:hypothetical protein